MIHSIKVTNHLGESKDFILSKPELSGVAITKIDGLGPPKATINMSEIATLDGAVFNSSRIAERNIVLSLVLLENKTVEETRLETYKYFPVKRRVKLLIKSDNRECEVYGYVESNDVDIFSNRVTTQVSIICPDPYFTSKRSYETTFFGIDPLFEFPFENDSLDEKLLEMGRINRVTERTIFYNGDAETGVILVMHAIGPVKNVTIYNLTTREFMKFSTEKLQELTGHGFIAGDEITISTVKGDKYATLLRGGLYTNVLNCIDKESAWFQISKGDNLFAYLTDEGLENLQFKMTNRILYEGV